MYLVSYLLEQDESRVQDIFDNIDKEALIDQIIDELLTNEDIEELSLFNA